MRRLVTTSLFALLLASCGQGDGGNQAGNAGAATNAAVTPGAPSQDLAALVGANPRLAQLVKAAGMEPVLAGKAPYTLLLPSNVALDKLDKATWEGLDQPAQKARITALLRGHILPGTIMSADLARAVENGGGKTTIATMAGEPLTVTRDGNNLRIAGTGGQSALITGTEQPARNGVVHEIDTVLAAKS
ncbi:fasciclin domain-containing protein [Sphingomonas glaciei]|uniref:Fasciclin domain-containing protein n=1 Tax=Sphingomonas glaciei TaxID=2938948 RepID=A0ABY5MTX5_9SPHN|nr:fasciclin domain-containing protein [Sphingomonas glaciei]UUR07226.1 fasciclin domain-containing protein [Sphingomonas glaciei]